MPCECFESGNDKQSQKTKMWEDQWGECHMTEAFPAVFE